MNTFLVLNSSSAMISSTVSTYKVNTPSTQRVSDQRASRSVKCARGEDLTVVTVFELFKGSGGHTSTIASYWNAPLRIPGHHRVIDIRFPGK